MSTNDRLIELFHQAKGIPAGEERDAFLIEACRDDVELREKVRALLQSDEKADDFLSSGIPVSSELEAELLRLKPEKAGDLIGPYKLREQIGEGGFGVVWVAEQEAPMRRTVALKIIKLGMDTREVVARFEQERQALALMDHPNIAKVFDAGATEYGRPYFVMELVRGIKITDYCDQAKLSTEARLALFIQVCHAVQHAHQKGIIHRDLKPSNILVTLHDGVAVPKVIDFGVAKATQGRITEHTVYTQFQQMIGTPLYMSPEQAEMSGMDIDTRTDIYALGVLLYELLTGRPPFDADALMKAGYDEMRRVIREEEPQKPSTALQTMAQEKLTTTAHHRGSEPPKLIHAIRGDLDWIVMKCLEKDRTRRYETASGLGKDVERHLEHEPVNASPPSAAYRFGKFARRHKAGLRMAVAILLLLLVAITVSSLLAIRAIEAEKLATKRLGEVSGERDAKEVARQESESVSTFMSEVFQSPNPARDGRTITVAETLDRAAKKLETDLADQPARRAKLQAALGATYYSLGLYRQAIALQEKVLEYRRVASGPEHLETVSAMHSLANSYGYANRWREALNLRENALALRRKLSGPEHPETLRAMHHLALSYNDAGRTEEAFKLNEEVLTLRRKVLGQEDRDTLSTMSSLAASHEIAGREDQALKLREEVLTLRRKVLGPQHPDTLLTMFTLATSYFQVGRREEALKLCEALLPLQRKVLGPEHPLTIASMHKLAECYQDVGRTEEALKLREEVLAFRHKAGDPEHPDTSAAMQSLANSYFNVGRLVEALKLREEALALERKANRPGHPNTFQAMNNLAISYFSVGRKDEAFKLHEEVLSFHRKVNKPEHPVALVAMSYLATGYFDVGRREEALTLREEELKFRRKLSGPQHPDTLSAMNNLAISYFEAGRREEALKLREEALALNRRVRGPEHPKTLLTIQNLAFSYCDAGRRGEALKLFEELLTLRRKVLGSEHPDTLSAKELVASHQANGDLVKHETLEKEIGIAKVNSFWGDRAEDRRVTQLYASGLKESDIQIQADGTWAVSLTDVKDFTDLTIFQGMRVSRLNLKGTAVADLAPLRGLALKQLNLEKTKVTDLAPLKGMPIEDLALNLLPISDLTVLRGMPLQKLELNVTAVADLEPLRGMALKHLAIHRTKVTDLSPLKGMPLEYLNLRGTAVKDISVVRGMPLTNLRMFGCEQLNDLSPIADSRELTLLTLPATAKDIEFLRTFPKLERLSFSEATPKTWLPAQTVAEFWEEYARRSPGPEKPAKTSLPSR